MIDRSRSCVAIRRALRMAALGLALFGCRHRPLHQSAPHASRAAELARATTVAGTVHSATGQTLSQAVIRAIRLAPGTTTLLTTSTVQTRSDPRGRYTLQLEPASYVIEADHPEHAMKRTIVSGRGKYTLDFTLGPGSAVAGVVHNPKGEPVEGALVVAEPERHGAARGPSYQATTRSDGGFVLPRLPPGLFHVHANSSLAGSSDPVPIWLAPAQSMAGVELSLMRGHRLSGRLYSAGDQTRSARGVWVTAWARDSGRRFRADQPSNAEGRFELYGVHPGSYSLLTRIGDVEYTSNITVTITDADRDDVVVEVPSTTTLSVQLERPEETTLLLEQRTENAPASVWRQVAARYVPRGMERLTLAGVPRGAVKLAAVGRDGLRAYANLDLREAQESISLKLSPHGSVSGRVVDAAGRPVPGVTVAVSSGMPKSNQPLQDRYTFVSVSTDDQGTFDAEGLPPGLYSIEVCHHLARLQWAKPPDSNDGSAPHFFRIEAHEAVRAIKLSVVPCDGAIAGTVRDMADRPVAGATVVARPEHRSEGPPFSTDVDRHFAVADHAGRFRLQALCPGSCELVAGDPEAALSARLAEVPTDSQVELKLAARGELSGDIRMGGMPVTDFTLELAGLSARRARLTSSTGSFRLTQLQHGEYELAVVADAGYLRRPIVVDARQRALSDLELTPWALVRGRVVDHRGRGVPQVVVTVSLSSEGYDPNAASPLAFSHQTRTASTCDDGTFTVDRLVRGIGQLAVWSPTSTLRLCPAVYQTPYGWWTGKAAYTRIRVESGAELDLGEVRTCRAEAAASADGLQ